MSADVIALADRRPPPATDPFAEPHEVVRFDLDRRARPVVDRSSLDGLVETTADQIARMECRIEAMRQANKQLLQVLSRLLIQTDRLLVQSPAADQGAQP